MITIVLAFAACLAWFTPARSTEPCERVVSYLLFPYQGSELRRYEWRIFDPSDGSDVLFLAMDGGFDDIRWDSTFRRVYFASGDSIYTAEWTLGARPRFVSRLPFGRDLDTWWFNPDSICWQISLTRSLPESGDAPLYDWCELWQSSRDGRSWRQLRADSVECGGSDCGTWPWAFDPDTRRARDVMLEDIRDELTSNALEDVTSIDTVQMVIGGKDDLEWSFLPSRHALRRGVAFRVMYSDRTVVSGPFYFVDLGGRTKKLIASPTGADVGWGPWLPSEHCGLWLLPGWTGSPTIVEAASGQIRFSRPWNSSHAVWVRPPRR